MNSYSDKRFLNLILFLTGSAYFLVTVFLIQIFRIYDSNLQVSLIAVGLPGALALLLLRKCRPLAYGIFGSAMFTAVVMLGGDQIISNAISRFH